MHTETISNSKSYEHRENLKMQSPESSSYRTDSEIEEIGELLKKGEAAFKQAEKEGRMEDMPQILDALIDSLPTPVKGFDRVFVECAKMELLFRKSIIQEKLGQMELALTALEEAAQASSAAKLEPHYTHYILRKSALLMALGEQDRAVEILKNHQPSNNATVLLYKYLEQKCNLSLFLEAYQPKSASNLSVVDLTMLGRMDEARKLLAKEVADKPYLPDEFRPEYAMLLVLHGDLPNPSPCDHYSWEQFYHFPLPAFLNLN